MRKIIALFVVIIGSLFTGISEGLADEENINHLLGSSVEYSGVEGGMVDDDWVYPDFIGEKAVDGESTSRWSADKIDQQWLILDMGEVKKLKEIIIKFHAESPSYDVFLSKDGVNYENIFSTKEGSQGNAITKKIKFEEKEARYVKYQQNLQWMHSNGKKYGSSIYEIEAYSEFYVTSKNPLFDKLLENRKSFLVGREDIDPTVLEIISDKDIELRNNEQTGIWDSMVKGNDSVLWENKSDWKTNSANLKLMTDDIQKMAIQYNTPNSKYYQDAKLKQDVLYALDWYYRNAYNEKVTNRYGNWFHWEVSIPKNLVNIYILMNDSIGNIDMENYILTIDRFIPDPAKRLNGVTEMGANLLDKCFAVLGRSILDQNEERYTIAMESSLNVYDYVTSGDGFYADGSFIQHTNVAYTGGYGAEVLGRIGDMIALFEGTDALGAYPEILKIFEIIDLTYKPTLIDGQSMSLTRGRRPSRSYTDDFTEGRDMLFYIYVISKLNSDEAQKMDSFWFVKSQVITSKKGAGFYSQWDINKIQNIRNLVENSEVSNTEYIFDSNRNMGMMTQMFHRKKTFSSAISLFSKTTTAFEYINEENKQGFYTGTGMYYLYNGDKKQYLGGYWGSIDMRRLPGTTTDGKMGSLVDDGRWLNSESWSGGVSNGIVGSASMHYTLEQVTKSTLEAKKSWFMLEDRIIALGAGIKSTEPEEVETIIENRKVTDYESAKLYVDGIEVAFGTNQQFSNPKCAYIDTGELDSSIGYIFPENVGKITAEYKKESKNWQLVNGTNPNQMATNRFMILAIKHGQLPTAEEYQYTVVPNVTLEVLKEEVENQDVTILKNSPEQQVIEKKDSSLFIGHFQEVGTVGKATAKTRGSILIQAKNNGYEIVLSDPMRMNENVEFLVDFEEELELVSSDTEITTSKEGNVWSIRSDTSAKNGQSKKIFLSK
ncbi:hypothetical protein UA3_00774 [Enterococcus faecium EnGen0263]|uniref:polysaccharide lyase family 8 super-sandwich domain-containing protein n=1 Tax=Enterococcus faecium TaxID=1352 RepID=UPI00032FB530|nr:polysaccharide lyase family 8 super-sandwich domain-containing protein [Enterococcus faecium]EOH57262.1 hypothetical protein UA3_00774 [Enterococcus faecium EnGen0263]